MSVKEISAKVTPQYEAIGKSIAEGLEQWLQQLAKQRPGIEDGLRATGQTAATAGDLTERTGRTPEPIPVTTAAVPSPIQQM